MVVSGTAAGSWLIARAIVGFNSFLTDFSDRIRVLVAAGKIEVPALVIIDQSVGQTESMMDLG